MNLKQYRSRFNPLLATLCTALYLLFFLNPPYLDELFFLYEDSKLALLNQYSKPTKFEEIVLIAIDDESLSRIPETWPWNRRHTATLIDLLSQAGARVIALEGYYQYPSPTDSLQDQILSKSLKRSGIVICQTRYHRFRNHKGAEKWQVSPPIPAILRNAAATGYIDHQRDGFQRSRDLSLFKFDPQGKRWNSFELESLLHFVENPEDFEANLLPQLSRSFLWGRDHLSKMTIVNQSKKGRYNPSNNPFPIVSFIDVLEGRINPKIFKNRIVFIGSTTELTRPTRMTLLNLQIPEIVLSANQVGNILHGMVFQALAPRWQHLILFLSFLLAWVGTAFLTPVRYALWFAVITVPMLGFDLTFFCQASLESRLIIPWLYHLGVLLGLSAISYFSERKEKTHIRNVFSHYVTASVVNEILKDSQALKLGGERRQLTVFFSDIEGFTGISERLEIERLVSLLNEYLSAMTDNIIFDHHGMLDKYEGDAIMAIFGAPIHRPDHAYEACLAALDNQDILQNELWKKWKAEGNPLFKIRIGINTGPMLVGNMGSRSRFDYTVIGDNVNVGARLENLNKYFGTGILISESTRTHLDHRLVTRLLDYVRVKGKAVPIEVYELIGREASVSPDRLRVKESYELGMELYKECDFKKARESFLFALKTSENQDKASQIMVDRCQRYEAKPPSADWDYVWNFAEKLED
jgi:adenylate cyclase